MQIAYISRDRPISGSKRQWNTQKILLTPFRNDSILFLKQSPGFFINSANSFSNWRTSLNRTVRTEHLAAYLQHKGVFMSTDPAFSNEFKHLSISVRFKMLTCSLKQSCFKFWYYYMVFTDLHNPTLMMHKCCTPCLSSTGVFIPVVAGDLLFHLKAHRFKAATTLTETSNKVHPSSHKRTCNISYQPVINCIFLYVP